MIGYVTLGTNDLQKAVTFYDALLAEPLWGYMGRLSVAGNKASTRSITSRQSTMSLM